MVLEEAAKLYRQLESRIRFTHKGMASQELKAGKLKSCFRGHRMLLTFEEDERVNQVAKNAIEALMMESSGLRASAVSLRAEETENKR